MSGFSIEWLQLREAADRAARDTQLLNKALHWLPENARIVDLGSGTGSTLRTLQAHSSKSYRWRLLDIDSQLLAEARRRHAHELPLETLEIDLQQVENLPLQDASLLTASALFDLVSQDFVDRLSARLLTQRSGFYAALNYNGLMHWDPAHPLDAAVTTAFNQDQQRDKGFGPALGPAASDALHRALDRQAYQVDVADSPWRLGPSEEALARELFKGIAAAVTATLGSSTVQTWLDFRLAHAADGHCLVGHQDILALPLNPAY